MYVITTVREIIAVCVSIVSCVSCFHSDVCRLYFIALHVFAPVSEGAWGPQHGTDERPGCKCRACLIRWLWGGSASLVSVLPSGRSCFSSQATSLPFGLQTDSSPNDNLSCYFGTSSCIILCFLAIIGVLICSSYYYFRNIQLCLT